MMLVVFSTVPLVQRGKGNNSQALGSANIPSDKPTPRRWEKTSQERKCNCGGLGMSPVRRGEGKGKRNVGIGRNAVMTKVPLIRTIDDLRRRPCYVGNTRTMEQLCRPTERRVKKRAHRSKTLKPRDSQLEFITLTPTSTK